MSGFLFQGPPMRQRGKQRRVRLAARSDPAQRVSGSNPLSPSLPKDGSLENAAAPYTLPTASQLVLPSQAPLHLSGSYLQREGQREVSSQGHQLMHVSRPWWNSSSSQQRREKLPSVYQPGLVRKEGGTGLPRALCPTEGGNKRGCHTNYPFCPSEQMSAMAPSLCDAFGVSNSPLLPSC